jgi:hypothetical protein
MFPHGHDGVADKFIKRAVILEDRRRHGLQPLCAFRNFARFLCGLALICALPGNRETVRIAESRRITQLSVSEFVRKAARVPFRSHFECVKKLDPARSLRESCRLFRAPVAWFGPLATPGAANNDPALVLKSEGPSATALLSRCGSSVQTLDQ